jgi:hypothetical protein
VRRLAVSSFTAPVVVKNNGVPPSLSVARRLLRNRNMLERFARLAQAPGIRERFVLGA